jgi:hypothetical protein
MENLPEVEAKSRPRGWLRRLSWWKKSLLVIVLLFGLILIKQLVAPSDLASQARFGAKMPDQYQGPFADFKQAERESLPTRMGFTNSIVANKSAAAPGAAYSADSAEAQVAEPSGAQQITTVPVALALPRDRHIIMEATLDMEAADVGMVYNRLLALAAVEGYIANASLDPAPPEKNGRAAYSHATVVLRVPVNRFDRVRAKLALLAGDMNAKIVRDRVSSEDVSDQYVDLESRLRHWRAQETQLMAIMNQAHKIPDILSVRNELSQVQEEIERIKGQLNVLTSRTDYSTITIDVMRKGTAPVAPTPPTIVSGIKAAGKNVAAAWGRALRDMINLVGYIVMVIVYLLPFAVLAGIIWLPIRAYRKKAAAKSV